jgi:hypothetical protein
LARSCKKAIRQAISNPNEVYQINPDFSGPPENPFDEKTWRVLSLINGQLSVEALVRLSNLGKFDTYWALDHLMRTEVIVRSSEARQRKGSWLETPRGAAVPTTPASRPTPVTPGENELDEGKRARKGKSGRGGLFSKRKGSSDAAEVEVSVPKDHMTDVGLVCTAVNALIQGLQDEPALAALVSQPAWVNLLWQNALQRYPRADCVRLDDNRLLSELYDRYAQTEGSVTRPLAGCHDDALRAVRIVWGLLKDKAVEALGGEKEAGRMINVVVKAMDGAQAQITTPDFAFNRWKDEEIGAAV